MSVTGVIISASPECPRLGAMLYLEGDQFQAYRLLRSVKNRFGATSAGPFAFVDPLAATDHDDLRWYLEVYAVHSLGEPDNVEAAGIAAGLPGLGRALFRSVFHDAAARALFDAFEGRKREYTALPARGPSASSPDDPPA